MKRGLKNILLSLVGFSAAPILTACYGMPYDDFEPGEEFDKIKGFVVDTDLNPIKDIRVDVNGTTCRTAEDGGFSFEDRYYGSYKLTATDVDGDNNGGYFGSEEVMVNEDNHSTVSVVMEKQ